MTEEYSEKVNAAMAERHGASSKYESRRCWLEKQMVQEAKNKARERLEKIAAHYAPVSMEMAKRWLDSPGDFDVTKHAEEWLVLSECGGRGIYFWMELARSKEMCWNYADRAIFEVQRFLAIGKSFTKEEKEVWDEIVGERLTEKLAKYVKN